MPRFVDESLLTYTVTFNANGQGTAPDAQTIAHGQNATEPTAPTATGYTFGGWYTDAACTTAYDFNAIITGNVTLYAKWTAITYTVTFDANGGSGTMSEASGILGNYTLPENTFIAPEGKQFKAWSVGGAEKDAGAVISVTANTVVTAIWEDIPAAPTIDEIKNEQAGITISTTTGSTAVIPAGTEIGVLGLPTANVEDATLEMIATQMNADPDVLALYDLSLVLDGNLISPNGELLVTLTVNTSKYDTVKVFYIADDCSIEACETTVNQDGTLTFETDHFSKYAVVGVKAAAIGGTNDTNETDTNESDTGETDTNAPDTDTSDTVVDANEPDADTPDNDTDEKKSAPIGAVIAIVIGSIVILGIGGFAMFWFVIKKKNFSDLVSVIKGGSKVENDTLYTSEKSAEEGTEDQE